MKAVLKTNLLALLSIFILTGFSLRENPEDPPRGEKKKRLKMVKVEDGKKTVIDTVITGDDDAFTWFSNYDFGTEIDSVVRQKLKKVEVFIDDMDGEEHIRAFKFDDKDFDFDFDFDINTETIVDGDSIVKVIVMKHADGICKERIVHLKHPHIVHVPHPPLPPKVKILKHHIDSKFIDLDDPDIISFKKKDLSGDREKIEIIRKKSKHDDLEDIDEIDIDVEVEVEDED